jgi:hypothetical protein
MGKQSHTGGNDLYSATSIYIKERGGKEMTNFQVELRCPEHGLERFNIKVIKKYNVSPETIAPKFRTRPKREMSGIIVGRKVSTSEMQDFMIQYFRQTGMIDKVVGLKLQL